MKSRNVEIKVCVAEQSLRFVKNGSVIAKYSISTALNGIGCAEGSYKTPPGEFIIDEKIGGDEPLYTIFKGRKPVGIWNDPLSADESFSDRIAHGEESGEGEDMILSRILWLSGTQEHNQNTKERYIYIHGTNHECSLGSPMSCGCVRMANKDITEMFDQVEVGDSVSIF